MSTLPESEATTRRFSPRLVISAVLMLTLAVVAHLLLWRDVMKPHDAPDAFEEGTYFEAPQRIKQVMGPAWASAFVPFVLTAGTLLGIVASIAWERAHSERPTFRARDLAPLVISPIVLLFTYSVAAAHPSGVIGTLMAFQNGFFWQTVLGKQRQRTRRVPGVSAT